MVLMMCTTMSAQDAGRGKREKATPEQRAKRMAEKLMLDDAATAKFVPPVSGLHEGFGANAACRV